MGDCESEMYLVRVGVAHTPYETLADAPRQGFLSDETATVEVFEEFADGLAGLAAGDEVTVVYWAHLADRESCTNEAGEGAFSRRTPNRPNPLNACPCEVVDVDGRRLRVRGLDAVDGSAVVDVRPTLRPER